MKTKFEKVSSEDQSSSVQIVASIDDLLTQILLHLPIRSLIRFKSISKHWNSIITDPQFCFLQNPNPNPAVGLFLRRYELEVNTKYEYVPLSGIKSTNPQFKKSTFINAPREMIVRHSCNGLLLGYTSPDWAQAGAQVSDYKYYVFNPTTNKFSTVPILPYKGCRWWTMSLAFDPAKSPYYKVVYADKLVTNYVTREHNFQFEVYSSESRVWRKCGEPFISKCESIDGVYWNGAIHWMDINQFLYLNIKDQILRVMPTLPHDPSQYFRRDSDFRVSCDHLHYLIETTSPTRLWIVYEMRRDYSEWFVKYQFDLSPVEAAYPSTAWWTGCTSNPLYIWYIFSLVRGEKDEDSFLVLKIKGKLIRYNIAYKTFETIYSSAEGDNSLSSLGLGIQYIESLCCV